MVAVDLLQQVDISDIPGRASCLPPSESCSQRVTVPLCHTRQPAVTVCSHCCAVSVYYGSSFYQLRHPTHIWPLIPDAAIEVLSSRSSPVALLWMMQLAAVWCAGEPAQEGAECCPSSVRQRTYADVTTSLRWCVSYTGCRSTDDDVSCTSVDSFTCTTV